MPIPSNEEREECIRIIREKTGFDGNIEFDVLPYLLYDLGYELKVNNGSKCFEKLSVIAYSTTFPFSFGKWIDKISEEIREAIDKFQKKWDAE